MSNLFQNLRYGSVNGFNVKGLVAAIEKGYESKLRGDKVVEKVSFAPSQLAYQSGRCPRRWVMAFQGKHVGKDTFTATSAAVVDQGSKDHHRIQEALIVAGVTKENEKEIKNVDPPIRGFVDAIVEIDGVEIPVEIKTTRQEAFEWRATSMKPAQYHMYQLLSYMKIEGYKYGAFVYENRNDTTLLVIPVEMDSVNQEIIDYAFEWMRTVYKAYEDGLTPVRPWKQTSPICQQCPFFESCWDDDAPEGDIKIKPMVVHKW